MILSFARFDTRSTLSSPARIIGPLLFVVVMGFIVPVPFAAIFTAAAAVSVSAGTPFLNDERGRLDTLYAMLPIARSTVVIGRYLEMLLLYVLAAALAAVSTWLSPNGHEFTPAVTMTIFIHALSFLGAALALAIQLPIFFAVGFTRARSMMFIPVVAIAVLVSAVTAAGFDFQLLRTAASNPAVIIGAFLVGFLSLAASVSISVTLYSRRRL